LGSRIVKVEPRPGSHPRSCLLRRWTERTPSLTEACPIDIVRTRYEPAPWSGVNGSTARLRRANRGAVATIT
jgi:hypothetical protein